MSDLGPLFDGQGIEFGHLQREAQRRQNAADAAQQKAQNAQIISLLKQQKREQDQEKQRLDALPKCPACLNPVEVGSRRCAKCQSAIVSWDNRSFRLICLSEDAGKHLQSRIDELSRQINEWAEEALRSATQYAGLINSKVVLPCKALAATLNKTRPDSVSAVLAVLECYLADKPLLDPTQLASLNDATNRLNATSQSAVSARKSIESNRGCAGCLFALMLILSCALVIPVIIVVAPPKDIAVQGFRNAIIATSILSGLTVAALIEAIRVNGNRRKDEIILKTAQKDCAEANIDCGQIVRDASMEWRSRFEKARITPHLDELKRAVLAADTSALQLNTFGKLLSDAMAEIAETLRFANTLGVRVKDTGPRVRSELSKISPQGLSPKELIEACNRGQFTALQITYDDAMRIAQSLQMLRKP